MDPEGTALEGAQQIPTEDAVPGRAGDSEGEGQAEDEGDGATSPARANKRRTEDKHADGKGLSDPIEDFKDEPQKGVKQVSLSSLLAGQTADSENGPSAELKAFLATEGLTEAVADKLFEVLGMTTIDDFGYILETRSEVHTIFWEFVPEWEHHGSISSKLKKARERAADVNQRNREFKVKALDDNLDAPILKEDHNSLTKEWKRTYYFSIPPTLEGNATLLGKLWRILKTALSGNENHRHAHTGNGRFIATS